MAFFLMFKIKKLHCFRLPMMLTNRLLLYCLLMFVKSAFFK